MYWVDNEGKAKIKLTSKDLTRTAGRMAASLMSCWLLIERCVWLEKQEVEQKDDFGLWVEMSRRNTGMWVQSTWEGGWPGFYLPSSISPLLLSFPSTPLLHITGSPSPPYLKGTFLVFRSHNSGVLFGLANSEVFWTPNLVFPLCSLLKFLPL